MNLNQVVTAGRMNELINCPRRHFWSFELGLTKQSNSIALRFGSAWHRAMEERWKGKSYDEALAAALPEAIELTAYDCSVLAALLAGYYDHYGKIERVAKMSPEIQFDIELEDGFRGRGKIDGLGSLKNGRSVLVEAKTTGDSIEPDSDYWLRLRFNMQVYQYADAAIKNGWDLTEVIYDVVRKPSIRPREVYDLDKLGRKIVVDAQGKRIYATKKIEVTIGKGKKARKEKQEVEDTNNPRQSGDKSKGWDLKSHVETPDEFCDRLWKDTLARPNFYYCRKEVPILDSEIDQFIRQRSALVKLIQHYRSQENCNVGDRDPEAWPRNVSTNTCDFCKFKSFCLQNISPDFNCLPEGFSVQPFNPELDPVEQTENIQPT